MRTQHNRLSRGGSRIIPLIMLAALLLWLPVADGNGFVLTEPDEVPFTDGRTVEPDRAERDRDQSEADKATADLPAPAWPDRATTEVEPREGKYAKATGTPVAVRAENDTAPDDVTVTVHDHATATRAGVPGLVVDLARDGDTEAGEISVRVGYRDFAHAYGGGWSNRLRLWTLTGDAITPLASANNLDKRTVTATVPVEAETTRLLLMAAGSGAGDYSASKLSPASTWSAEGNGGGFGWSYPLPAPDPVGAGPAPQLELGYDSASVDGRNEATNNQPGAVGEGWDLAGAGSIERRYAACMDDRSDGANNSARTGDKCWVTGGTVMVNLDGHAGEAIRDDATGEWHLRNDDGTRLEKLTDTSNADGSDEYWRVTTPDGTKYYFGLNRLPGWSSGKAETNSVNTVPVAGNHSGEPCHESSFAASFCDQAWQWNLDYVVDPSGNTMSYWYSTYTNRYAKNLNLEKSDTYTRDSVLNRVDYGTHNRGGTDSVFAGEAPGSVALGYGDRCLSDCGHHDASHWPDTPWDQECTGDACKKVLTPAFYSTKMLTSVSTTVWDAVAGARQPVDSWGLTHTFPDPGDGTRAGAWLDSVQHTGKHGGSLELPKVGFEWVQRHNRVEDYSGVPTMNWMRMNAIRTESGGRIGVSYTEPDCGDGDVPSPSSNTRRCYPVKVNDPFDDSKLLTHWYHKYVVTTVSEADNLTRNTVKTRYEYLGDPAWRYAEPDAFTEDKYRTWSQWRGYAKVRTRIGDTAPSLTETSYFRGLDGDRDGSGGTRDVTVPAGAGDPVGDDDLFAGMERETTVYDGDASKPVSRTVFEPWKSAASATRVWKGDTTRAHFTAADQVGYEQLALGSGDWRTVKTTTGYDEFGLPVRIADSGDTAVTGDETCTFVDYVRDESANLLTLPSRIRGQGLTCDGGPAGADDVLSDVRTSYDGKAHGAAPSRGLVTATESITDLAGGTPQYVTDSRVEYDAYGRQTAAWDVKGNKTTTAYSPDTGRYTESTTTNPLGWTETARLDARGNVIAATNVNGRTTTYDYDALGRVAKVWLPNRSTSSGASFEYSYSLSDTGLNTVTTKRLNAATTTATEHYTAEVSIMDGFLREVQTQTVSPAADGGRIVTDTGYDDHGRAATTQGPYRVAGDPDAAGRFVPDADILTRRFETRYDAADRPVAAIQYDLHDELWRTTIRYDGNTVTVVPPRGGVATTERSDALGRIVERRQHLNPRAEGDYQSTQYGYDNGGRLTSMTDPEGNEWTWDYDVRGNRVSSSNPDSGTSSTVYNEAGEPVSVTDARGVSLAFGYDELGRRTGMYEGAGTDGTRLAEWRYDEAARGKGLPSGWSRFTGGDEYRFDVLSYSVLGLPMGVQYTIPDSQPGLAGDYRYTTGYTVDGQVSSHFFPQTGDLSGETVYFRYDERSGLPLKLTGNNPGDGYVSGTTYTGLGEIQSVRYAHGSYYAEQTNYYDDATRRLDRSNVYSEKTKELTADTSYTYDPAGNPTRISDSVTGDHQCFDYDDLQRLESAWTPADGDCAAVPSASSIGGPAPYWTSYAYDPIGNRTSMTRHGTNGGSDIVTTYDNPASGEPRPHAVTSATTETEDGTTVAEYDYDEAGNTVSRPGTGDGRQTLAWDAENLVVAITDESTGDEQSNIYTPDGQRLIGRAPNGDTTLFLPGQDVTANASGATTCTRYYAYAGSTFAARQGGAITWLFNDHNATATIAVDESSAATQRRYLDPHGNVRGSEPESWPGERGFVGGVDDDTGLAKLGARDYDAELGTFTSVDPILDSSDPAQVNSYGYSGGNPVSFSDPNGLCFTVKCWKKKFRCWFSWAGVPCAKKAKPAKKKGKSIRRGGGKSYGGGGGGSRGGPPKAAVKPKPKPKPNPARPAAKPVKNPAHDPGRDAGGKPGKPNGPPMIPAPGTGIPATGNGVHCVGPVGVDPICQSKFLGDFVSSLIQLTGGECKYIKGLRVCTGGWAPFLSARDGTTIGDTFVTGDTLEEVAQDDELIAHEKYHRDYQWYVYGWSFIPMYYAEEWVFSSGEGCNKYEQEAEQYGGQTGYSCP